MAIDPVLYSIDSGVATLTLNRPDVLNAFNEQVIDTLAEYFRQAGNDATVRAVVLRGAGKSFCAGGDLNWMRKTADYSLDQNIEDALRLAEMLRCLNHLPKPTLAMVHGNVFGGGVGLTACCDVAIAEEGARFSLSEVRIGLIPSVIEPYVMAAIGERQTRRYSLTAERFDTGTALRIGLVHEIAPVGGLDVVARCILDEIMKGAPSAQARGKKLILATAGRPIDDDMVCLTAREIAEARASKEGKDGLSAFLNKTEPAWRS